MVCGNFEVFKQHLWSKDVLFMRRRVSPRETFYFIAVVTIPFIADSFQEQSLSIKWKSFFLRLIHADRSKGIVIDSLLLEKKLSLVTLPRYYNQRLVGFPCFVTIDCLEEYMRTDTAAGYFLSNGMSYDFANGCLHSLIENFDTFTTDVAPQNQCAHRSKITHLPHKCSVETANKLIDIATTLLQKQEQRDLMEAIVKLMSHRSYKNYLSPSFIRAAHDIAIKEGMIKDAYELITMQLFPPVWKMILAKDAAIMSFQQYHSFREHHQRKELFPPQKWIQTYQTILNEHISKELMMGPAPNTAHEYLFDQSADANVGGIMKDDKVIYINLKCALRWHIYHCIAAGCKMDKFLFYSGNDVLIFKLAFDTTVTNRRELFMLGVIPQNCTAGISPQSADSVIVLCLAAVGESKEAITQSIPFLKEDIADIQENGISLDIGDIHPAPRFRVEFHLCVDLKAMWVGFNQPPFTCIFCTASNKVEMNQTEKEFPPAELNFLLGIPMEKIHICSLHLALRVAERFIKCQATSSYIFDKGPERMRKDEKRTEKLSKYLCQSLRRSKFKIGATLDDKDREEKLMEIDNIYVGDATLLGDTVNSSQGSQRVRMECSALTGPQASKIFGKNRIRRKKPREKLLQSLKRNREDDNINIYNESIKSKQVPIYKVIIDISEGQCNRKMINQSCPWINPDLHQQEPIQTVTERKRLKTGKQKNQISLSKVNLQSPSVPSITCLEDTSLLVQRCRPCRVRQLWEDFVENILPLLSSNGTPERLQIAIQRNQCEEELDSISTDSKRWIRDYKALYGCSITPYLHILGFHLAEMLRQPGNSIGNWSQEGFEACHKRVRRIFEGATSHGGGKSGQSTSALRQIMHHLQRVLWCQTIEASEEPPREELSESEESLRKHVTNYVNAKHFRVVESRYTHAYPSRSSSKLVKEAVARLFKGTWTSKLDEMLRNKYLS